MNLNGKRILVLSPHPDDGELGAGATIAKLLEQKNEYLLSKLHKLLNN